MSGVVKVTGLSPTQMMGLFPFVIQIAYLFPLTYLLRVFRPAGNAWWAGVWFFYLFNWTGQDYFAPQALAFLLFLCLLALFAHVTARREGYFAAPSMALVLGLYGCLVLTHVLTAGIVVAIMACAYLKRADEATKRCPGVRNYVRRLADLWRVIVFRVLSGPHRGQRP